MLYTSCCILHTPCACTYDNLLASQDVFIHSYIHLMSTAQLDRSRSPTMPCILLVGERERANLVVHLAAIFLYIYIYIYRYITGAAHTVIPIQRQHAHKIATSGTRNKEDASRFRKRGGRGDTIIQTPKLTVGWLSYGSSLAI